MWLPGAARTELVLVDYLVTIFDDVVVHHALLLDDFLHRNLDLNDPVLPHDFFFDLFHFHGHFLEHDLVATERRGNKQKWQAVISEIEYIASYLFLEDRVFGDDYLFNRNFDVNRILQSKENTL